jgi:hypothetical protein
VSRRDRAIAILLGLLLGIAIIVLFVLVGSEETIDAPSLENGGAAQERPARDDP